MDHGRFEREQRRGDGRNDWRDRENERRLWSGDGRTYGHGQDEERDENRQQSRHGFDGSYDSKPSNSGRGERGAPRGRDEIGISERNRPAFGRAPDSQGYRGDGGSSEGYGSHGRPGNERTSGSGWGERASEWDSGSGETEQWGRGGNLGMQGHERGFTGRGPKGYQRSDDRIREDISDRLTDDHAIDASEVTVQVQAGEVTLTGTVDSRDQKRRVEELAERISGVREVLNDLRVSRQQFNERKPSTRQSQDEN